MTKRKIISLSLFICLGCSNVNNPQTSQDEPEPYVSFVTVYDSIQNRCVKGNCVGATIDGFCTGDPVYLTDSSIDIADTNYVLSNSTKMFVNDMWYNHGTVDGGGCRLVTLNGLPYIKSLFPPECPNRADDTLTIDSLYSSGAIKISIADKDSVLEIGHRVMVVDSFLHYYISIDLMDTFSITMVTHSLIVENTALYNRNQVRYIR